MFKPKIILWLLLFTCLVSTNFGQSFTYSGPSQVTIPYGSTTATATFYFTYYNLDSEHKVIYPMLNIKLDGVQVNTYTLCNNPQTPSSYGISLTPGVHTITFTLMSVNWYTLDCYDTKLWQESQVTVNCKFNISVENIFGGGSIYADGNRTSPFFRTSASGDNVSLGAIEQNYGGYNWVWSTSGSYPSEWRREPSGGGGIGFSSSQNTSYSVQSSDLNTSIVAGLRKVCGLTFQANSSMSINGNYRTSPYTESVVEQNSISAIASNYSANGIDFTFSKWSTVSGDVYSPITASEHKTYTAVYTGKPSSSECSITFNTSQEGQPVNLSWSKHPLDNSSISHYAIWRKVTTSGTPTLLTTVSATGASSYSYTDYEFAISSGANKILLFYDVRPYYSPDNSYSDPSFEGVYGV